MEIFANDGIEELAKPVDKVDTTTTRPARIKKDVLLSIMAPQADERDIESLVVFLLLVELVKRHIDGAALQVMTIDFTARLP